MNDDDEDMRVAVDELFLVVAADPVLREQLRDAHERNDGPLCSQLYAEALQRRLAERNVAEMN